MRTCWTGILVALSLCAASPLFAQQEAPVDALNIAAARALTWPDGNASVIQLEGPVAIELDNTRLTAESAVIWITPVRRSVGDYRHVEVALIGNARIQRPDDLAMSGRQYYVDANVRGSIRIEAVQRVAVDMGRSDLYQQAKAIRSARWLVEEQPTAVTLEKRRKDEVLQPVSLSMDQFRTMETPEGKVAAVLSGNVILRQITAEGELLELQADRAVVFTPFTNLRQLPGGAQQIKSIGEAVTGAYLEGDVRITRTPRDRQRDVEQRLEANRAFYDFTTDRAVLTDVILHTRDPKTQIPIIVRAQTVRQLSEQEYTAEKARISTSSFHTPSYSIGASTTYIRISPTADELLGRRATFAAEDATLDLWNFPVFYVPNLAGSVTERNIIRGIQISNSSSFGTGISTQWGLFETLGRLPPRGTDASYRVDYFSDRGPAVGLDGQYLGGTIDEGTLDAWSYAGDLTSYLVLDNGEDHLGRRRHDIEPEDELRGRFYWQHQHFLPSNWQVQLSGGYLSDPTFLEEWFNRDFRNARPFDTSLYAKYQHGSEAFTFLVSLQPNDFPTVADLYQEQAEIERFPELAYHRIGDSFWADSATFFSANTISAMRFKAGGDDLEDLGFGTRMSPGLPSFGEPYNLSHRSPGDAVSDDVTLRGDFRQEIDFPFTLDKFRAVPYVVGRLTEYSDTIDGGAASRLLMGAGIRMTTAFWKVDDAVRSELFDLHRLRHVVEPELHVFTSAQSEERTDLLIYDEPIDAVTEVSVIQLGLNQRWQTKRGGPGRWRSVDFLTLNVRGNFFMNEPDDHEMTPVDFRGLYFVSFPEASIPRTGVNADAAWQVSDNVQALSDAQYNTEESQLATASGGFRVRQDPRLSYFVGLRHIGVDFIQNVNGRRFVFEDMDLLLLAFDYQLTRKYRLNIAHSYDLAQNRSERSALSVIRHFDRFYASVSLRIDEFQDEQAVIFNVWPEGLPLPGASQPATGSFDR